MQDPISKHASCLELSIRVFDLFAIAAAGQIAGLIRFKGLLDDAPPIHSVLFYLCSALACWLFAELGLYESWRGRSAATMFGRLAATWALVLSIGLIFSFLIHHVGELSRLWLFYWYIAGTVFIVIGRWVAFSALRYFRRNGVNSKNVVIVGYGPIGRELHKRAQQQDWYGYNVKAVHAAAADGCAAGISSAATLERAEDIPDYVAANHIDEIWIALPMNASDQLQKLQFLLRNALVDIRWVPDLPSIRMLSSKMGVFLGFPAVDLNQPSSAGLKGIAKDLFDKMFALTVLILLIPLFAVIAICIKWSSPGPVFFKQPRHGLNGKQFNVYKFRSMKLHQEHGVVTQASKHDPRVTRIGEFIRRTSLDELPQFINVLFGDMSVVGPRPHALQHNEMYKDLLEVYMLRHRVKPGITGLAQINGHRGETDTVDKMAKRVQFDLYYIQNWSLWMDMKIIAWTAFKGWTGKNAY